MRSLRASRRDIRARRAARADAIVQQHWQHDEFELVQRAKLVEGGARPADRGALVLYLAARLLYELPFKLAWAAGAD